MAKGHDVQHSQFRYLMANINHYKVVLEIFSLFHRFLDIKYYIIFQKLFYLKNISQDHAAQHSQCNGAIPWQIPDFLSDCNSTVCFISHHLRDVRYNNKMSKF